MPELAIKAEGLSKRYLLGRQETGFHVARRLLGRSAGRERVEVLSNLSFEIPEGQAVAVIGHNGAGKSTLLKILSRIVEPTAGYADVRGRVGALLEVGTGFHGELTGRENVYLSGTILGMRRQEIRQKFDEIVEFSGIGKFIDTPVKRYSSGMFIRLGFAVSAFLEPEILIVDEVLAVGDLAFQERCLGKMRDVAQGGRTVLFVSHNMSAISALCPEAIWLEDGKVAHRGPSSETIERYVAAMRAGDAGSIAGRDDRQGTGAVRVRHFGVEDLDGNPLDVVRTGDAVRFVLGYESDGSEDLTDLKANVVLSAGGDRGLASFVSEVASPALGAAPPRGRLLCEVPELPLMPGLYDLRFSLLLGRELVDKVYQAGSLVVSEGDFFGTGKLPANTSYFGPVVVRHSWSVEPAAQRTALLHP